MLAGVNNIFKIFVLCIDTSDCLVSVRIEVFCVKKGIHKNLSQLASFYYGIRGVEIF